jgi:acetyl-CoA C-acetyltransferase
VKDVFIIGVGVVPARPLSPDVSYRELIFEAAIKAYEDAGITNKDVETFVAASEDFNEGVSIFDEYVPDQIGAVLKPVHTIGGDGLMALAAAYLQIATGGFRIAFVESHSKLSNLLTPEHIEEFALDPIYFRNTRLDPKFLAGLDMQSYMARSFAPCDAFANVVCAHRKNAMKNPVAGYPAALTPEDVLATKPVATPLLDGMCAKPADGACCVILANRDVAEACKRAVAIDGIAFYTAEPHPDTWKWGYATYAELCAKKAYKMAGVESPENEVDLVEADDRFPHKFFEHLEALRLSKPFEAYKDFANGKFSRKGRVPANLSGGHLGIGMMHEATCLYQLAFAVKQLRGEAGEAQLGKVDCAVVQSWRGLPTQTGALAVLRRWG